MKNTLLLLASRISLALGIVLVFGTPGRMQASCTNPTLANGVNTHTCAGN